jgi:threonyl-tRNA synthetase
MEKIPYILVVGDKEEESSSVSVRKRRAGDQGLVPISEFLSRLKDEIEKRLPDS